MIKYQIDTARILPFGLEKASMSRRNPPGGEIPARMHPSQQVGFP